jgi:hypothetical protein
VAIDITRDKLITLPQVAADLGLSRVTVLRWVTRGIHGIRLEAIRAGRSFRTTSECLQQFLDDLTTTTTRRPAGAKGSARTQSHETRRARADATLAKLGV